MNVTQGRQFAFLGGNGPQALLIKMAATLELATGILTVYAVRALLKETAS